MYQYSKDAIITGFVLSPLGLLLAGVPGFIICIVGGIIIGCSREEEQKEKDIYHEEQKINRSWRIKDEREIDVLYKSSIDEYRFVIDMYNKAPDAEEDWDCMPAHTFCFNRNDNRNTKRNMYSLEPHYMKQIIEDDIDKLKIYKTAKLCSDGFHKFLIAERTDIPYCYRCNGVEHINYTVLYTKVEEAEEYVKEYNRREKAKKEYEEQEKIAKEIMSRKVNIIHE